jgi:hypothetical protein
MAGAFYRDIQRLQHHTQHYWSYIKKFAKDEGVDFLLRYKNPKKQNPSNKQESFTGQDRINFRKNNHKNSSGEDEVINESDESIEDQTVIEFNSIEIKERIYLVMFVVSDELAYFLIITL